MTADALQRQFEIYQDTLLKLRKDNKKLTKFQVELVQRCLKDMIHYHNIIYRELDFKMKEKKSETPATENKI